ncbi:MAG: 2-isopropylmalate synthase [Eubacteriales bacterium]|nr:2-isopropylmalate synthase [Eubacteriales bacterium]
MKPFVEYSEHTGLLEQSAYRYRLQDVDEPNLHRYIYDYENVPKISFNHRLVPMNTPEELWVTDTTFRDGQQSTSPFTVEQIVHLFTLMHKLGGPKGLVRQSEFFVYTDKDKKALQQCMDLGYEFPEVTTWIRANEKDFDLVKNLGIKETGILVSCSDYHIFKKMKMTRGQAMDMYLGVVKSALSRGIRPRCHFEDITRADYYGFVVPFAIELMKLSKASGIPIKIRACDTLGYGVCYPGAALPRSVPGIIYGFNHYAGVPSDMLEWHGHNDFYKVVTNAGTAWLYGCSSVNCSLLGLGERTGNCPLEAMLIEYASLKGTNDGMDLSVITEIADYMANEMDYDIPPRTPFVGRNFNATRAGIHADGLLKDEEIYNIFDTGKILKRPPTVMIGPHSGAAGILHWINGYFPGHEVQLDKNHPTILKMKEEFDRQFESGRQTTVGDKEMEDLLFELDEDLYIKLTNTHHRKL